MSVERQPADDPRSQAARLRQFLAWLLPTIVGFAGLEGGAALAFADGPTLGTALILVAYAGLLGIALVWASRGRVGSAVAATCGGLLTADLGVALLQPALYPTLAIVPLLAVAVALPYIGGRPLRRLIVGCWLVIVLVAVLGQTLPDRAALPAWFAVLFHAGALAAAAVLSARLLWQFSDRLTEALARLEAQRERLQVTLDSIGDGVIATDAAGAVTLLNPVAEALTGWPRAEALGRPFREIFPIIDEATRAPAADPIAAVLRTGARVGLTNHTALRARDGAERSIADSAAPIRDQDRRLHGVVVVFSDVTERQRAARDQRLLAEAGAALAASLDVDATLAAVGRLAVPALADWFSVELLEPDGSIRVGAMTHADPAQVALGYELRRRYPMDPDGPRPPARVIRTGRPLLIPDVTDAARESISPGPEFRDAIRPVAYRSLLCVPLAARGRVFGALLLGMAESGRRYDERDLALGEELARRAALAIDNARLYAAEQAARRRLAVLAETSAALAGSLDYEATLARVARLVVAGLADWCTIELVDGSTPGGLRRLAVAHADPAKEPLVARLADYPPAPPAEHPVLAVVRTGQPALAPDVPEGVIEAATRDATHLALVRAIGMRSFMIVPLRLRERILGAICLARAEPGRRYGPDDLALAEQLADRAALAIDNARLYREAQAAVRIREEFLAVASHELRTPLTSVKGYVQLLDRHLRGADATRASLRHLTAPLLTQVQRLETLVDDLLDVSRIQQGRLDLRPEPVDLGELARQVAAHFEHSRHRTPRHVLVVDAPSPVAGEWDASRLDQVLTNLIGNALKFSPAGGEVRVAVRREGAEALVRVSDHGLGIGPEDRAALFQPFQRGEATARAIPGVGLGLYISAGIVARHGGRIEVTSVAGEGSTFTIRLPMTGPAQEEGGPAGAPADPRR